MSWYFYFLFLFFFNFFRIKINCILNVNNFVNTSALGLTNINGSLLADNGQTAYISFKNGSTYSINKYSISAGVLTYVNKFVDPNNAVNADRLLIYNSFLIAYQSNGFSFNAFYLSNFTYYGNYVINENVMQFYPVTSKGIILYINVNGNLKYILESNFLASNTKVIINSNMSMYPMMSISPDENYIALASGSSQYVYVYSLTNYSVVTTFTFPFYATQYSLSGMVWRSSQVLVLFSEYNCIIYQVSIPAGTYNATTTTLVPTCSNSSYQTMFLVNLVYIPATDQIVGAATYVHSQPFSAFFSYSLSVLQITYFTNVSFLYPTSYSNQADNNLLFSNNNATNLYFGSILPNCTTPYVYNASIYQCEIPIILNTTNTTNITNLTNLTTLTNATNATNTTNVTLANTTSQLNITNSTNFILSLNSTNLTGLLNITNLTNTSTNFTNSTNASQITIASLLDSKISDFQTFVNNTLRSQQLFYLNSVPGSRKYLQPIFTFFVNFDDLWLYVYHQRQYDEAVTYVFSSVQQLQIQKWNFLPIHTIWQFLGLQSNNTLNQFSSKITRTSYKFYDVQQNANGFILNTLTFICSNVFLMFIMFLILHILFYLLFNYRISILFRVYSFWLYFLIVMLQGNLQYLTYLFSFEIQNFFNVNYINKFGLAFAVILYFGLFIFSLTVYPVVKYNQGKLVRYFVQNMKLSEVTAFYMAMQMGYRNIILGFLHSILDEHYFIKIGSLMSVQIMFLSFTLYWLSKNKIFYNHLKVWVNILAAILRILLIFTFFLDYQNIYTDMEFVHIQIFYIYISEMLITTSIQGIRISLEVKRFIFDQKLTQTWALNYKNIQFKQNFKTKKTILKTNRTKNILKIVFVDEDGLILDSRFDQIQDKFYYKKSKKQKSQENDNVNQSKKINLSTSTQKSTKLTIKKRYKMNTTNKTNERAKTNIIITKQTKTISKFVCQNIKQTKPKTHIQRQRNPIQQKSLKIQKIQKIKKTNNSNTNIDSIQ